MYKKIDLKYDSLEPYIDDLTLNIHYNKHYLKYLNNLNTLLNNFSYDYRYNLEELIRNIDEFDSNVRGDILFNIGGVLNHELYFKNLNLNTYEPTGLLKDAIDNKYGSFNNFKQEFINSANNLRGSGFTFLVIKDNDLDIINLPNFETPYMYNMIPLIALDMFEHAYYIKYQNNKEQYIKNFFSIIDFKEVEKNYEKEIQKIK